MFFGGLELALRMQMLRSPPRDAPIPVRLLTADALSHSADVALIGYGGGLRSRIEAASGLAFAPFDLRDVGVPQRGVGNVLNGVDRLDAPDFVWRQVFSVDSRPSRRVRRSFEDRLLVLDMFMRRCLHPQRLLLVPFRPAPVETVAMQMLFHIWCMHRLPIGGTRPRPPREVVIVDRAGPEVVRELIVAHPARVQDFVHSRLRCHWWVPGALLSASVSFDIR